MVDKTEEMKQWISDTQMFQRIAGTPESSFGELEAEWKTFSKARKERMSSSIKTHLVIQRVAKKEKKVD